MNVSSTGRERIHVEVRVAYRDGEQVIVFYGPTDKGLGDALPIEKTYDLRDFPQANKLRDGMETMITVHPGAIRRLQM